MSVDIFTLAQRANQMERAPGFQRCDVESEADRELAFHFDTASSAHAFLAGRNALGIQARISDRAQHIVVVKQP